MVNKTRFLPAIQSSEIIAFDAFDSNALDRLDQNITNHK